MHASNTTKSIKNEIVTEDCGWYGKASHAVKPFDSVHLIPL